MLKNIYKALNVKRIESGLSHIKRIENKRSFSMDISNDFELFRAWFAQQNELTQVGVLDLLKSGRLELYLGVSTNKAVSYQMMVDQYSTNLEELYQELKVRPRVAWSKDQQLSQSEVRLLNELGFDSLLLTTDKPLKN